MNNLKALSGRVIVNMLDEVRSGLIHLPQDKIQRAGSLMRARVLSSGITDICEGDIVHCKAELGYRVPLTGQRIYLEEDILLVENDN